MATRPDNKYAVTVRPCQGPAIVILIEGLGAADALVSALGQTDAAAVNEGCVRELPMIINGDVEQSEAQSVFGRDFRRVMLGRKLIEVRDMTRVHETAESVYWTANALWVFEEQSTLTEEA